MSTKNTAADAVEPVDPPHDVVQLVDRFKKHAASYRSAEYLETRVRREFLDPFFVALGWDVDNRSGYAEAYKEVIHEDSIKVPGRDGGTKAPDYCFRIGGARKFFVEAKKPSVNIRVDMDPAYQLRRYAWSAKLPLSLLTDFEELAVYDCRLKPTPTDATSTARTAYFTIDNYLDPRRWAEIAAIFSKDAILKGSFDRYVDTSKRKRGTAEVDDALLDEIENWRELLAKAIAKRNPQLSVYQLNHVVQATVDRIMFLRIAEDRGIEPYGALLALTNGEGTYKRLFERFRLADQRYNSGLFHFEAERGRIGAPDEIAPDLQIDDKPLKQILKGLYYPESPYEFSVFAPEILGQVYEQFLGKVIRLTPAGLAKIEEKPEVKKAGGVFYTPAYIVDYILEQTIGAQLNGKTPEQIGAPPASSKPSAIADRQQFTVLDPACGSGSFLLGAYQFLLDWYLAQYLKADPAKHADGKQPRLFQKAKDDWRLTSHERKRILTSHIYGVDIDPQACEVTKLSLLLKVLEGENDETIGANLRLFHERALPDLSRNIKCGNSLVGADFYDQSHLPLVSDDLRLRTNVFDWRGEFPNVMKTGGFDAVVGNPPYIRIQTLRATQPEVADYLARYKSAEAGNYDIYVVFAEKAISLLRESGRLGFIMPHKFFNAEYGEGLRRLIADGRHLEHLVHFGHQQVFRGATTYTCLMFCDAAARASIRYTDVSSLTDWRNRVGGFVTSEVPASAITAEPWSIRSGRKGEVCAKVEAAGPTLEAIAEIFVGVQTSADKIYHLELCSTSDRTKTVKDAESTEPFEVESDIAHPLVSGGHVKPYVLHDNESVILFPYDADGALLPEKALRDHYPLAYAYLRQHRRTLEEREKRKFADDAWYRFGRNQNIGRQHQPKLCVPRLVERLRCACDLTGRVVMDNVDVNGIVCRAGIDLDLRYIAGLLNSRLMGWFFPNVSAPFRGGWYSANRQFLGNVPIRTDFASPEDAGMRDKIVDAVELLTELHSQKAEKKTALERDAVARQIASVEAQIDRCVYHLYRLDADDIALVEHGPSTASASD